jgi:hypothetical protein
MPLPYRIIVSDGSSGKTSILCYTITRTDAQQVVDDLAARRPDLRFAILADEDGDEDDGATR